MLRQLVSDLTRLTALVLLALLGGCASGLSVAVPTVPGVNQSTAQAAADEHACEKQAFSDANRDLTYQACMIGRGYWTTVGVGAGAFVDVFGMPRPYDNARTDLVSCLSTAPQPTGGTVALTVLFGQGMMAGTAIEAQQAVIACMSSKGYQARRWAGRQ